MPRIEKGTTAYAIVTEVVEMRGIEPLSEKILPRVSPSAVGVLNLPRCIAHQQAMHFGSS